MINSLKAAKVYSLGASLNVNPGFIDCDWLGGFTPSTIIYAGKSRSLNGGLLLGQCSMRDFQQATFDHQRVPYTKIAPLQPIRAYPVNSPVGLPLSDPDLASCVSAYRTLLYLVKQAWLTMFEMLNFIILLVTLQLLMVKFNMLNFTSQFFDDSVDDGQLPILKVKWTFFWGLHMNTQLDIFCPPTALAICLLVRASCEQATTTTNHWCRYACTVPLCIKDQ